MYKPIMKPGRSVPITYCGDWCRVFSFISAFDRYLWANEPFSQTKPKKRSNEDSLLKYNRNRNWSRKMKLHAWKMRYCLERKEKTLHTNTVFQESCVQTKECIGSNFSISALANNKRLLSSNSSPKMEKLTLFQFLDVSIAEGRIKFWNCARYQ